MRWKPRVPAQAHWCNTHPAHATLPENDRPHIEGTLILKAGGSADDPLNQLGTLGFKIMLNGVQYGGFINQEGIDTLGLRFEESRSLPFDLELLTEGALPKPIKVRKAQ